MMDHAISIVQKRRELTTPKIREKIISEILAMICARHRTIIFDDLLLAIA